jgi:hypothetical protein
MQVSFIALAPDQLLSLIAAQITAGNAALTVAEAVDKAADVIAEASIAVNNNAIGLKVQAKNPEFMEEQRAKAVAAERGIMVPTGTIPSKLLERNRDKH